MRPELPRLASELDAMARLGVLQGQGDPVARMAEHAEAAMAQAWEQALHQAMGGARPPAPAAPEPGPRPQAEAAGPRLGAQGPVRPPNPPAGPAPFATSQAPPMGATPPLAVLPPGYMALASPEGMAQGLPAGGWPMGTFPPGVVPYAQLPPGAYGQLPQGQAPWGLPGQGYGALPPGLAGAWGLQGGAPAAPAAFRGGALKPELQQLIEEKAAKHGVPAWLVKQVVLAESGGNPKAVSPVGAQGLMQLMPETARELGVDNPFDPADNVDGGVRYLKRMMEAFGGDLPKAVAAYNAGPGAVARHGGVPPYAETQAYVRRILGPGG